MSKPAAIATPRSRLTLAALAGMFLVSGATGLMYEVVWFRLLFLRLGGTGLAVATVTAAFMAGLGLGAWLFGTRLAQRTPPIRLYAILEGFIGLYALAVPALVDLAGALDAQLLGGEASGTLVRLARFLLAGSVLLPPTIAMGGTLPALSRLVESEPRRPGRFVGLLYGLNTTGAVAGAATAGFVLLPHIGFVGTVMVAAAANLALAVLALGLSRARAERTLESVPRDPGPGRAETGSRGHPGLALLIYALSGLVAFMLQVSWTRILSLVVASSSYAFSFILSVFLAGLGLGALLAAPLLDRVGSPRRALGWTFFVAGGGALLGQGLYDRLPRIFLEGLSQTETGLALGWVLALGMIIMLPSTLALGAGFPLVVRLSTGDRRSGAAARVGRLYAANTTASVMGAFLTALLLIPALGLYGVVSLAGCVALGVVALLALTGARQGEKRPGWLSVGAAAALLLVWLVAVPGWNRHLMSESVAFWRDGIAHYPVEVRQKLADLEERNGPELLFYKDGVTASVAVKRQVMASGRENLFMTVDGKIDASSVGDLPQQILLAHLPLLARDPKDADVLVIGYASGITTGSVLTHPVSSVVVAEIEEEVFSASHHFDEFNGNPLEDERVEVVADDARAYMRRTDRTFDVITSSPSSSWLSGPAKLFTREFFALARSRLKTGGLLCQYVQAYDLQQESVLTLLRTVQSEFRHVAVLEAGQINLLVLASSEPIVLEPARLANAVSVGAPAMDLARAGYRSPCQILERVVAEPSAVAAVVGDGPLNTDDNALLEHRGPHAVGLTVSDKVLRQLRARARGAAALLVGLTPDGPLDSTGLAQTCLQARSPRTAASLALHSLDHGPDPTALWILGEVRRDQNQRLEAIGYFEDALQLAPSDERLLLSRALTLKELGRLDESLAAWDEALEKVSEGARPLALAGRGQTRLLAGDAPGAVSDLSAARASGALPPALSIDLGRALMADGRPEQARVYLEGFTAGPSSGDPAADASGRALLARQLTAHGAPQERIIRLQEQAAAIRQRVLPRIVGEARVRLRQEGDGSAGVYLREMAARDPGLRSALMTALDGSQEDDAELLELVEALPHT